MLYNVVIVSAARQSGAAMMLLFSRPVMSHSLRPHGLQHARPLCPSPSPEVCSSLCPCESAIHIHISPLIWISFPCRSPQSPENSSLCHTVGSHQLSVLHLVSIVYMCQSQTPNSSHRLPPYRVK